MSEIRESKMVRLLGLLDASEQKQFEKWLCSPWCNSTKHLITLYRIVLPYLNGERKRQLTKEGVYARIFEDRSFNKLELHNLMSKMIGQVKRFLVHQRLEREEFEREWSLMEEYSRRGLPDDFLKSSHLLIAQLAKKENKNWKELLQSVMLNERLYFYFGEPSRNQKDANYLDNAKQCFDTAYAQLSLRMMNEIVHGSHVFTSHFPVSKEYEHLKVLSQQLSDPAVRLYFDRLNRTSDWGLEELLQLKQAFINSYEQLSEIEQKIYYIYLYNDAILLYRRGNMHIHKELFDLLDMGIRKGLVLNQGYLSDARFVNIVQVGTSQQEAGLIQKIIPEYLPLLKVASQMEAKRWALAQMACNAQDYERCMAYLVQAKFQHDIYSITGKFTELKANFYKVIDHPRGIKHFESFCKNYEKFMRRNKVLVKERSDTYVRFMRCTRQLALFFIQAPQERSATFVEEMKKQIIDEEKINGKPWLLQILEQA